MLPLAHKATKYFILPPGKHLQSRGDGTAGGRGGWLNSQQVLHVVGHILILLAAPEQVEFHVQSQDTQVGGTQEVVHCSGGKETQSYHKTSGEWAFLMSIMKT